MVLNSCLVLSRAFEMVVVVSSRLLTFVLMLSAFWLIPSFLFYCCPPTRRGASVFFKAVAVCGMLSR